MGSSNSQYDNEFRVWTDSGSDGLRITAVKVVKGSDSWEVGTFDDVNLGGEQDCTGCNFWSENCGSCWLDRDGHGDCAPLEFDLGEREVYCTE